MDLAPISGNWRRAQMRGSPTLNLGDFLSSREELSSLPGRDDIADTPGPVLHSAADL